MKVIKGISLIETVIVIAVIAVLSLIGTNTIINFKNDASMDSAVSELVSDIKLARNKSMNGEVFDEETVEDFHPDYLPEYGISLKNDHYTIIRKYSILNEANETTEIKEDLENFYLDSDYVFSNEKDYQQELFFERITGKTSEQTFTLIKKDGKNTRQIVISSDFLITVSKK